MTKKNSGTALVLMLGSIMACLAQGAEEAPAFLSYGEVVHVQPVYDVGFEPTSREVCHDVTLHNRRSGPHDRKNSQRFRRGDNQALPTLLGGLIGGVIGHQFGRGRGKTAMTLAGSLVGMSIANTSARDRRSSTSDEPRYQQRCSIVRDNHPTRELTGYEVTYRYQGKEFVRTVRDKPGARLPLRVHVQPVDDPFISENLELPGETNAS